MTDHYKPRRCIRIFGTGTKLATCGRLLPADSPPHARYCSATCRGAEYARRKRLRDAEARMTDEERAAIEAALTVPELDREALAAYRAAQQ